MRDAGINIPFDILNFRIHSFFFQSCPFVLEVFCNKCRPSLQATVISENRSEVNQKAVLSSVLNNYSKKENVKGMKDLILFRYESTSRVTLVLQNLVSYC